MRVKNASSILETIYNNCYFAQEIIARKIPQLSDGRLNFPYMEKKSNQLDTCPKFKSKSVTIIETCSQKKTPDRHIIPCNLEFVFIH